MFDENLNQLRAVLISFKQSILFYPIIFTLGVIILFTATSRIDELYYQQVEFDNPYIGSLIFSGDADASRNMLSAISAGWATILGVAFSVSLITLQLSTSKYTSHLVNKFENDKINQLTLAWFIATVLFSLLVLKTVRTGTTGEGGEGTYFTPILGVNISIFLAGSALFVFIAFLHNIASYLRPNMLVSSITEQITKSLEPYKKRKEFEIRGDKSQLLPSIDNQDNNYKENYNDTEPYLNKAIFALISNQKGLCRSINWEKIYQMLQEFSKQYTGSLWMQWYKTLGDHVEKNDLVAVIYLYNPNNHMIKNNVINTNNYNNNHENNIQKLYDNKNDLNDNNGSKNNPGEDNKHDFNHKLISNIIISKDRDVANDPTYGIELVRSLAVKSANQSDTDVVGSCITGLFRVLRRILRSTELLGIPFTLNNESYTNKDDHSGSESSIETETTLTIINPRETKLSDAILFELSIILENSASNNQITVFKHFINEYIALSRFLLEINRTNEFHRITKWCVNQLLISMESFQKQFQGQMITDLINFKKEMIVTYPKIAEMFENEVKSVLTDDLKKYINISIGR